MSKFSKISKSPASRLWLSTLGGLLLIFSVAGIANNEINDRAKALSDSIINVSDLPVLQPKPSQKRAAKLVSELVYLYHYRRDFKFDDEFSKSAFDAFLKEIDPAKIYLTQEDLKQFAKNKTRFDDMVFDGDLEPVYNMFDLYRQRWVERYQYSLSLLDKPFDFTLKESYDYDREESDYAKDLEEINELWRKKTKNDVLSLILTKKTDVEVIELLKKRYKTALRRISQTESTDVFRYFMDAVTQTIEPHTSYFTPRTAQNFNIDMALSLEGIGAVLQTEDVYTKVVRLVEGGPADRSSKIAKDDVIVAVGQDDGAMEDVIGWRLDDVVDLIRGKSGSKVRLELLPAGASPDAESKKVTIIREKIKLEDQEAKSKIIEVKNNGEVEHFGVITLPKFYIDFEALSQGDPDYKSTTRDVKILIEELKKKNIDGIIMDLRNNGGGSLREATSLTGLFIDSGPVVLERDYKNKIQVLADTDAGTSYDGPLMVLVNRFSASASEIFAGAIQDYGRGLIVGGTTYGKGTIQQLQDLDRWKRSTDMQTLGQLKYTGARFYRISGESTQIKGVEPDISLPSSISNTDYGESLLEHTLPWDTIPATKYQKTAEFDSSAFIDQLRKLDETRVAHDPAFNFLKKESEEFAILRKKTSISLNKEERIQERDANKIKDLDRINQRRKIQGLATVTDIDKIEDEQNDSASKENDFDPGLTEAGFILKDYIHIGFKRKNIASVQYKAG
ncbi:MAG: tail-specific protease [Gammaproteobacteria bacterium CG22_combo_CG10-13_8_21_14_all_40_8]|nr:MAG: tail-specific protease [Gammaproteobacteria bacterium CG22_combo_CG10-13_8_21_14_all_40_8]